MGYRSSTPPQVLRVVGGWALGIGLLFVALGFPDLTSSSPSIEAVIAFVLFIAGGLMLIVGSRQLATTDKANRRFFSENSGTDILATRRHLQTRLERIRWWLFLTLIGCSVGWVVVAGTYSCVDDVCTGFLPRQETLIGAFRWMCVIVGTVTLVVASLARVHGSETDRWEDLASDYLRRRDDGATPGLKRSRWE